MSCCHLWNVMSVILDYKPTKRASFDRDAHSQTQNSSNMAKVSGGSSKAAAIVGFLILCCGIPITTCGVIWIAYGGYQGHGLWSGIPLLVTGFLGLLALTRNNCLFTIYLLLSILTSIGAGIQAVTGGLELLHWNKFIGNDKCSVQKGACTCIGVEKIRISDLDSCDKIPTINDIFITIIFFSVCGAVLCLGGAIAGCVGLATVPRSQPTTLPRKPKPKPNQTPAGTLQLDNRNAYPPVNDVKKPDHVDSGYSYPADRRDNYYPDKDPQYRDDYYDNDRYHDDRRDVEKDRLYRDERRDDYDRDRYPDDRRDDYYDKDRYRDDRRDYDRYSDRSYDSYDRRSYDRDSYRDDYDDRRSHEGRKTPTYL